MESIKQHAEQVTPIQSDMVLLEQIKIAAWAEIPVNPHSPVYKLFQYRQECAKQFFEGFTNDTDIMIMKESFKHCNEQIKKYLGL